jgi:predicted DCC family thiol-disulfide oxidoreductase YuxK
VLREARRGAGIGALERPLVVWDGDCGFCRRGVGHLRALTGERVAFEPYQTAAARFPDIPVEAFRAAVHLIEPEGRTSRGAEAVFRTLACGGRRLPLAVYRFLPGAAAVSEWGYRLVARQRPLAARLTQLLVGDLVGPPRFRLTRFVFLRLLALVYLAAFLSLGPQLPGLAGEHGLLPARELLLVLRQERGTGAFLMLPTLGWLGAGDRALAVLCYGGAAAALLAFLGFAQGPLFAVCWAAYLSLVQLGQDFLSFQWDALLVEAGFLALLLAPWAHLLPRRPGREPPAPRAVVWLLRLLLFKLMFSSGLTKLTWGDPTWHGLTALTYHYWTQPLPTPLAWYANRLPRAFQMLCCALMFGIELLLPFLIFTPRRPRRIALVGLVGLQALIAATGNYGFFNLLAVVLCVPLLDDAAWPLALRARLLGSPGTVKEPSRPAVHGALLTPVAVVLALLSAPPLVDAFHTDYWRRHPGNPLLALSQLASPFLVSNGYGLFRTMTTTRPELDIEASLDGLAWRPIVFRYKAGDPARAPRFVAPHMPRLDWQMWFAALRAEGLGGDPVATRMWLTREDVWLGRLLGALLRGTPQVLELLGPPPFGETPPRQLRLVLWEYRFSDGGAAWWTRTRVGVIAGPVTLPPAGAGHDAGQSE